MDNQDIYREYEKIRKKNNDALKTRIDNVYEKVPRIKEIDDEVSKLSIKTAKLMLKDKDWEAHLYELMKYTDDLMEEKTNLLKVNNIPKEFFELEYDCEICKDTGFDSRQGRKCACFTKKQIIKYYSVSNIFYTDEDFSAFDLNLYSNEIPNGRKISPRANMNKVLEKSLVFIEYFGDTFQNLFFCGETGQGKTFLCKCIGKELLNRDKTVLYMSAYNLMHYIESVQFNRDDDMYEDLDLSFVYNVDLLIIDDLGTEFSTSLTRSTIFNIVNQRIEDKRATIISSNLKPSELKDIYSERFVSRIMGLYDTMEFYGAIDIRLSKKHKNKG